MDIIVELHCDQCGSANLSLPERGSDGQIACNDCGETHGTMAELQEALMECAVAHGAEARRRALEGIERIETPGRPRPPRSSPSGQPA